MGNLWEKSEGPMKIEGRRVCLFIYNVKHTYKAYTIHMNMITNIWFYIFGHGILPLVYLQKVSCMLFKMHLRVVNDSILIYLIEQCFLLKLFQIFCLTDEVRSLFRMDGNHPARSTRRALVFVLFKVFTVPSICLVLELVLPLYLTLGTLQSWTIIMLFE